MWSSLNNALVVDDDPIFCVVAESFFRGQGLSDVFVAGHGDDALKILEQRGGNVDFILLDLKMPIMDGIQFLRQMHELGHDAPIIIISGEDPSIVSLAKDLAKQHGLNIAGTLEKPLNFGALEEIISELSKPFADIESDSPGEITEYELKLALSHKQFCVHYQPVIELSTSKFAGVEALARWTHPERGSIPPGLFVPLAEEFGFIGELTEFVIQTAIDDSKQLSKVAPHFTTSVNLSADVLNNLSFPDEIAAWIDASGLDRSKFIFEITESKLVQQSTTPMEILGRLNLMGFELSIDDFGTGYSNLEQLRKYPFRELKLDRSFVGQATVDRRSRASVLSCVTLGKELGMRLVAEGVETEADWQFISDLKIDRAQGFKIAKPMPINDLCDWVITYQRSHDGQNRNFICA